MTASQSTHPDPSPEGEQVLPKAHDGEEPADGADATTAAVVQPAEADPVPVISSALDSATDDQPGSGQIPLEPPDPQEPSPSESSVPDAMVPDADVTRVVSVEDWPDTSPDATQVVSADIMNVSGHMPPLDRTFDVLAAPPPLHGSPPRGFPAPPPYGHSPVPPPPQHGQPSGQPQQLYGQPPLNRPFDGFSAPSSLRGSSTGAFPSAPQQYGQPIPPYGPPQHYAPAPYGPPQHYAPAPYGPPQHYAPPPYGQPQPPGQPQPYLPPQQNGQALQYGYKQQYGQPLQYSLGPPATQQSYTQAPPPQPYAGQPGHGGTGVPQRTSAPPGWSPAWGAPGGGQLPGPLAGYGARVLSFMIDSVAPAIVLFTVIAISAGFAGPELILVITGLGYLGLFAYAVWNSCYRQGTTGQSIGRQVAKTKLVKIETGQPVGFGTALLRQICHNVEFIIGFLWPLWDARRQTFADKIVGTVVVRVDD